jgi:hypothetical protein
MAGTINFAFPRALVICKSFSFIYLRSILKTPATRSALRDVRNFGRPTQFGFAVWTTATPDGKCVRLLFRHLPRRALATGAAPWSPYRGQVDQYGCVARQLHGLVHRNIIGTSGFSIRRYTATGRKRTAGLEKALQVVDSVRNNKFRSFVNAPPPAWTPVFDPKRP